MDLKPIASIETRGMCLIWCSSCIIWLWQSLMYKSNWFRSLCVTMCTNITYPLMSFANLRVLIAHNATIEVNLRVKGDWGMLDPTGESGTRPGSTLNLIWWPLLVTLPPEMWVLNFLRPFSGAGPATVSSQSLCKNPITPINFFKRVFVFVFSLKGFVNYLSSVFLY